MVPVAVSHSEFWQRYFYKVHRLEQDEARREALKQRAEQSMHQEEPGWEEDEEEFLGMSPLPCGNITFPGAAQNDPSANITIPGAAQNDPCANVKIPGAAQNDPCANVKIPGAAQNDPCANITIPGAAQKEEKHPSVSSEPVLLEQSPSESSESVSFVTQIANPVPATPLETAAAPTGAGDLCQRLVEATLEEQSSVPKPSEAAQPSSAAEESSAGAELRELESKGQGRTETVREEGPTDLRVFELNSDSGKSTPSNNGKKGSSTDISEDWEKDFDLDMTEEEVQLALSKVEMSGELEDEEWEDWE
uniref:BSD domain-containing protein n=1 Tax=Malurus cyaneus samueli TaxID=2593467 RepID=A0A8C5TYR6_9PASS